MKFIISDHAKKRINERIGAKERKHLRLVEKAWRSNESINKKTLLKEYQTSFQHLHLRDK